MKRLLLMIIVVWGVLVQMIAENTLFYDSRQLTCDLITSICQDKDLMAYSLLIIIMIRKTALP